MVVSCVVVGCTNRCVDSSLPFHRIPKEEKRRQLWLNAIKRKQWTPKNNDRVCGRHFISGKASTDSCNPDYVPSLHMGYTASDKLSPEGKKSRFARLKKRLCQKEEDERDAKQKAEAASILLDLSMSQDLSVSQSSVADMESEGGEDASLSVSQSSVADMESEGGEDASCTNADIHDGCISQMVKVQRENQQTMIELARLQHDNETLTIQCERQFGEKFLKGNQQDSKTTFFTGLPSYSVFVWLLGYCTSILPSSASLCPGDIILLILMKLRLNLLYQDLSYRFNILVGHVSDILNNGLPALAKHLNFFIQWPEKEQVLLNMPTVFRETYSNCHVIIDCTEVFIECPANLTARSATWSNYKHHNTLKFLVACSPCGAVTFVSQAYGGRTSDKVITQRCGFLDLINQGDLVLADQGFLIGEDLAACGVTLVIPDFTR